MFIEQPPLLADGLRLDVEPIDQSHVLLVIADDERRFAARAAGLTVPYPSGLRRLVASDPSSEVVLVERASPGLGRAAAEAGVGYLDLQGLGHLRGPGFVYLVSPHAAFGADQRTGDHAEAPVRHAAMSSRRKPTVSAFAPKASRIARALLSDSRRGWKLSELASKVGMNPGNVHRILDALDDMALVERDTGGYRVPDPGSLLEAWAEQWRRPNEGIVLEVGELEPAIERVFGALGGQGALSGEWAAELYAPHLPATHAIVYCTDRELWHPESLSALAGPPVLRRPQRVVVQLADERVGDFGTQRDGLAIVSPQQLYVDLYRERARGREAAEHVRREVLGY